MRTPLRQQTLDDPIRKYSGTGTRLRHRGRSKEAQNKVEYPLFFSINKILFASPIGGNPLLSQKLAREFRETTYFTGH